jgi:hypothetical protein
MGLDAVVFCNCYEKGTLKRQPPNPELVYVLPNGDLRCHSEDDEILERFDRWRSAACKHEDGMIAGDCLGNINHIGSMKSALRLTRVEFPILRKKVLFCGSHTGDFLKLADVEKLQVELDRLKSFRSGDKELDKDLQALRRQLLKLTRISLKIRKPIAF